MSVAPPSQHLLSCIIIVIICIYYDFNQRRIVSLNLSVFFVFLRTMGDRASTTQRVNCNPFRALVDEVMESQLRNWSAMRVHRVSHPMVGNSRVIYFVVRADESAAAAAVPPSTGMS